VNDGKGTKVVIDTVFIDTPMPDSIILKDGSVVLLKHPGDEPGFNHRNGKEHLNVTYSTDSKDNVKDRTEVIVISSDSLHSKKAGNSRDVYYYSNSVSKEGKEGKHSEKYRVVTIDSKDTDNKDSDVEKSRYIIAKDGIVVTIEGKDEAKTKELAREIEDKLGVNNEEKGKKNIEKTEVKNTVKK
jgi:hypothetical protein